jgi:hypothetical protein
MTEVSLRLWAVCLSACEKSGVSPHCGGVRRCMKSWRVGGYVGMLRPI